MNRTLRRTSLLFALPAAILLSAPVMRADSIVAVLTRPVIYPSPGSTDEFTGTITAPATNSATIYLNGDTLNAPSPFTGDESPFVNSFLLGHFALNPGDTFSGAFFDIGVPLSARGDFIGSFDIQGGSELNDLNLLATLQYQVSVPEPGSLVLLSLSLTGVIGAARRKA